MQVLSQIFCSKILLIYNAFSLYYAKIMKKLKKTFY